MILAFLMPVLGVAAFHWLKAMKEQRAREKAAAQFRVSLQNMVHALRAGVGLTQAVDYAAREGQEPVAGHWRWMLQALQVGKSMSDTLEELTQRLPLREAQWFATAVQITHSTGGSLAEVLDTLANVLQEQQNLREKVSALTAQGKASGVLLGALPFLVLGALALVAPEMARPMFTTWKGQALLCVMIVMVACGGWIIRKIVTVPVD